MSPAPLLTVAAPPRSRTLLRAQGSAMLMVSLTVGALEPIMAYTAYRAYGLRPWQQGLLWGVTAPPHVRRRRRLLWRAYKPIVTLGSRTGRLVDSVPSSTVLVKHDARVCLSPRGRCRACTG